jgi:hypothetical protein
VIAEPAAGLARFVSSVAVSVAQVQANLGANNRRRVEAWQRLIAVGRGTPLEGVVRAVAPPMLVVENCFIQAQVSFEHQVTNEFSIRILNAGVTSRYGSTESYRSKLQVEVRRTPLPLDHLQSVSSPL